MTLCILLSAGPHPASDKSESDNRGSGSDCGAILRLHMCPRRSQAGASAPAFIRGRTAPWGYAARPCSHVRFAPVMLRSRNQQLTERHARSATQVHQVSQ